MPQTCGVIGCSAPVVARGLCDSHYRRLKRHGHTESTRAEDYGKRSAHPAYSSWKAIRRSYGTEIPKEWKTDFWAFVRDVPERPEAGRVARADKNAPFGPNNFYWQTSTSTPEERADNALYMRNWQRRMRAANPRYGKDAFLRKRYGVTLEWYDAQHAKQKGLCAICDQPETEVIGERLLQLAVDHCHEHGHARQLLCCKCNQGLGAFKDNATLLRKAADYLDSHQPLW